MIIVEAPRLRLSNFSEVVGTSRRVLEMADMLSVPDVPFGKNDASPCALLARLSGAEAERTVPVLSAGHRDHVANISMIKAYAALGAKAVLIVQGDGKLSKASEVMASASKFLKVGAVFSRRTYRKKINSGSSFFVTQLFPDLTELAGVDLQGRELYLSYFVGDKSSYERLQSLGISVPNELLEGRERAPEYIVARLNEAMRIAGISGVYLTVSYGYQQWAEMLKEIINNLKEIGL